MKKLTQCERILRDLKDKPGGVTACDYPAGFPIRSRISDLVAKGHNIKSSGDENTPLNRYQLVK